MVPSGIATGMTIGPHAKWAHGHGVGWFGPAARDQSIGGESNGSAETPRNIAALNGGCRAPPATFSPGTVGSGDSRDAEHDWAQTRSRCEPQSAHGISLRVDCECSTVSSSTTTPCADAVRLTEPMATASNRQAMARSSWLIGAILEQAWSMASASRRPSNTTASAARHRRYFLPWPAGVCVFRCILVEAAPLDRFRRLVGPFSPRCRFRMPVARPWLHPRT